MTIPIGICRYCLRPEHPSGTICPMHPALLKERMEPYAFTGEPDDEKLSKILEQVDRDTEDK